MAKSIVTRERLGRYTHRVITKNGKETHYLYDNLKGKSTIVIVAHRLSTIKNVDKIFFLDEGKIVDSGTFDKLFKKNEKFKNMFLAENI